MGGGGAEAPGSLKRPLPPDSGKGISREEAGHGRDSRGGGKSGVLGRRWDKGGFARVEKGGVGAGLGEGSACAPSPFQSGGLRSPAEPGFRCTCVPALYTSGFALGHSQLA